mgnify:FL=1
MNKKTIILLHVCIWVMLLLSPVTFLHHDEAFSLYKYLMVCVSPISLMVVFYVNYFWLVPKYLSGQERRTYWIGNLLMMVGVGVAVHFWMSFVHNLFDDGPKHAEWTWINDIMFILRDCFNVAVTAAVATAIGLATRVHHSEEARLEAEAARAEAELRNLRSQINPHFLLNTLNNIYALTAFDTVRAQEAIQQLSKMLRHMLYDNQQEDVPLADEVQFLENYVNLMKIRLPQNVDVRLDKQIRKPDVRVAPLIFISLIENAFKHGISPTEPSFIRICLRTDVECVGDHDVRDLVVCTIENSNHPKTQQDRSGHGIGLEQVQRRLDLLYPNRYEWTRGVGDDGRTYSSRITLRI